MSGGTYQEVIDSRTPEQLRRMAAASRRVAMLRMTRGDIETSAYMAARADDLESIAAAREADNAKQ